MAQTMKLSELDDSYIGRWMTIALLAPASPVSGRLTGIMKQPDSDQVIYTIDNGRPVGILRDPANGAEEPTVILE